MIIKWFFDLFFGLLHLIFTALPTWNIDWDHFGADLGEVGRYAQSLNAWFPVNTMAVCMGLLIGARLGLFSWTLVLFIYNRIPGKAT
jgi:hypothetical protein